jgi:hypothetical protein
MGLDLSGPLGRAADSLKSGETVLIPKSEFCGRNILANREGFETGAVHEMSIGTKNTLRNSAACSIKIRVPEIRSAGCST